MKVLYITNIPSPYRVDFFNELNKYCELTVLFERSSALDRDKKWYNNNMNFKSVFLKGIKIGKESSLCLSVLKHLNKKYDVVVIGGYSTLTSMLAIKYLKMKKIPFMINADGGMIKGDKKIVYKIKKHFISSANWWLSSGKKTTEYFIHYGAKKDCVFEYQFSSMRSDEIINELYNDDYKKELKTQLGVNYDKVILSIGQFIPRKGFDILLEAWQQVNTVENVGLYIIGGGPDKDKLLDYINKHNLTNVHIIDFLTKDKLKQYYIISDFFVFPTRYDIWGLVVNEAMSFGLPIVSSEYSLAALELVTNNYNGFIYYNHNITELSNKINLLLNDNKLLKTFAKNSLEIIRDYNIEKMALDHYEIFKKII